MKRKHIILLLALLMNMGTLRASVNEGLEYGLTFISHSFDLDHRTGLNLSAESAFDFRKGFSLEFDMKLYSADLSYGYIFRIISASGSIDFLSQRNGRLNFILSDGGQTKENISLDSNAGFRLVEGEWYHVVIDVHGRTGGIDCRVDGIGYHISGTLPDLRNVDIRFGWNSHPVFYTTDVPFITVKDIKISSRKGLLYYWKLSKHNGETVYDLVKGRKAEVKDGVWDIDSHYKWAQVLSLRTSDACPMLAYDRSASRIFLATSDSLHICSMASGQVLSSEKVSGHPLMDTKNQMVYDSSSGRLVCYSMHNANIAEYDFSSGLWKRGFSETWPPIIGHCRYLDEQSGKLYLFGGYGNHRYNADMTVLDLNTMQRTVYDLSPGIYPRYFSSMCIKDDGNFLVMGGYGSRSGLQEESPGVLNDIYEINKDTFECTGQGTFVNHRGPMIFSSSMVYAGRSGRVYALAFNNNHFKTSLNLVSFGKDSDSLSFCAGPVDFRFNDMESWSELVADEDFSRLYAMVFDMKTPDVKELKVYSLAFPPLSENDVLQPVPKVRSRWIWISASVVSVVLVFGISAAVVLYRRRRKAVPGPAPSCVPAVEDNRQDFNISLMGGFRVFDFNNEEITLKFTPLIRQLFFYILLVSNRKDAITYEEMTDTFWFGMEKSAASNNRNVNIRKLRVLLKSIGDISLVSSNDILTLDVGENIKCDYYKVMSLLKSAERSDAQDMDVLAGILSVAEKGTLLPGYEYEWLDKYKSRYSERLISVLVKFSRDPSVMKNNDCMLRIADVILAEDCIDEYAVRIKCQALVRQRRGSLSKHIYEKYCMDYRRIMGEDLSLDYDTFIKQ